MITLEYSAHELAKTRICQALDCGEDALPSWGLCIRHDRKHRAGTTVPLHAIPTQLDPVLCCARCHAWKPDAEFAPATKRIGGPVRDRRGRHHLCVRCESIRQIEAFNNRNAP